MLRHILFAINLLRAVPAYCAVCLSGAKKLICAETEGYMWFLETYDGDNFFLRFAWLMWRYDCYRSHVVFRCSQASTMCSYLIRLLYPPKKDMEVLGQIGEGLVIYHGHGTVIAPYSIGKNFSVYQGVTIGRNAKPGREINNSIKNLAEESSPQAARACAQQTVRPFISKGLWPSEISEKARRSVLFLVTRRGFEPRTHCLKGSCSAN